MKKFQLAFLLYGAIALFGCGKENPVTPVYSSVLFVNAAVTAPTAPGNNLYLNDSLYWSIIQYNTNTGYLGVTPGTHIFKVKQEVLPPNAPVTIATDASATFDANRTYTLVAYDSLDAANTINLMRLNDDLTVPDVNSGKVRFWSLAPNYPSPVDVTYLRTSATPADSVTISNRVFPGSNPNPADHEGFTTVPSGTYTIRVKLAGTQTVVTSISGVTVGRRKIYSHYLTGTAQGRPLAFGQVIHF